MDYSFYDHGYALMAFVVAMVIPLTILIVCARFIRWIAAPLFRRRRSRRRS